MFLVLIILLTFTDFETSGQNIETEETSFCKILIIEFYDTYILEHIYCILCMYISYIFRPEMMFSFFTPELQLSGKSALRLLGSTNKN